MIVPNIRNQVKSIIMATKTLLILTGLLLSTNQHAPTATSSPAPFLPSLNILPVAMAVDRSKFRTCHQSSFCRRHRHGKSKSLYDYKLDAGSVVFHDWKSGNEKEPSGAGGGAGASGHDGSSSRGGLLSSLSRRLMGHLGDHHDDDSAKNEKDPYVRGPSPIMTANLINVAPFTSSALTAQTYGNGCGDASSGDFEESLQLSVHLHRDGVARVRIKEVLSDGKESARSVPRWTSDELVLNEEEMIAVERVQVISVNPFVYDKLSTPTEKGDEENEQEGNDNQNYLNIFGGAEKALPKKEMETIVTSLATRASSPNNPFKNSENYIVLSYGTPGSAEEWKLMLQLEPFAVFFFRGGMDATGPPIIAAGTSGLTHFEVRRPKECTSGGSSSNKRKLTEGEVGSVTDEDEDRHKGKEIVGYWEDVSESANFRVIFYIFVVRLILRLSTLCFCEGSSYLCRWNSRRTKN